MRLFFKLKYLYPLSLADAILCERKSGPQKSWLLLSSCSLFPPPVHLHSGVQNVPTFSPFLPFIIYLREVQLHSSSHDDQVICIWHFEFCVYKEGFFSMKEFEPLGIQRQEDFYKDLSEASNLIPRIISSWPCPQPSSLPGFACTCSFQASPAVSLRGCASQFL